MDQIIVQATAKLAKWEDSPLASKEVILYLFSDDTLEDIKEVLIFYIQEAVEEVANVAHGWDPNLPEALWQFIYDCVTSNTTFSFEVIVANDIKLEIRSE